MAKDQIELEQMNAAAAVIAQPTEAAQTVTTETAELSKNQPLNRAEIVELVATIGSMESELEMKREENLGLSV
jgi:hypothetical protein